MQRKPFTILAAISLLLCVATVGLWVRSYHVADEISGEGSAPVPRYTELTSDTGKVWFHSFVAQWDFTSREGWFYANSKPSGVVFVSNSILTHNGIFLRVPHWTIAVILAILPTLWFVRRQRRTVAGRCSKCGYDLRATPERCPECGLVPKAAK